MVYNFFQVNNDRYAINIISTNMSDDTAAVPVRFEYPLQGLIVSTGIERTLDLLKAFGPTSGYYQVNLRTIQFVFLAATSTSLRNATPGPSFVVTPKVQITTNGLNALRNNEPITSMLIPPPSTYDGSAIQSAVNSAISDPITGASWASWATTGPAPIVIFFDGINNPILRFLMTDLPPAAQAILNTATLQNYSLVALSVLPLVT
jgi:hypothetical protein